MKFAILLSLAFLLPLSARSQARTWTFTEDGKIVTDSGEAWSFKKKGRIDAAFVRMNGTNVILLTPDAKFRAVPVRSLSQSDRSYLEIAGGITQSEAANMAQAVAGQSAAAKRVIEATRLKNEAFARRRLAQLALDTADRLENEAAGLSGRAGGLASDAYWHDSVADTLETSSELSPAATEASVHARATAAIKNSGAENIMQDAVRLRHRAADERANAARFQSEAANFERASRSLEINPSP
jgi:sugar (pentulose or hexulose) kinase